MNRIRIKTTLTLAVEDPCVRPADTPHEKEERKPTKTKTQFLSIPVPVPVPVPVQVRVVKKNPNINYYYIQNFTRAGPNQKIFFPYPNQSHGSDPKVANSMRT